MTPLSRNARTRPRQVEGAMPTRSASALFGMRASATSSRRRRRSISSNSGRTMFDQAGGTAAGLEFLRATEAIYRIFVESLARSRADPSFWAPESAVLEEYE